MTLLENRHRQGTHTAPAQSPYWSLALPRWAAAPQPAPRPAPETTWTCARCGAVASGIAAAQEHINLHSLQSSPEREGTAERLRTGARRRRRPLKAAGARIRIAR